MKKNLTLIIMLLCFPTLLLAATETLLDFGWKFYEGDVKGAQAVEFDDSKWQNEAGTLRAEAGGKTVTLATAGEPARLRLTTDRKVIAADGQDLSYITVEVVDRQGRVVPDAAVVCNVQVTGSGTLAAAGSADLKDLEALTSPKLTTWKGRGMIVVRSKQKAGKVSVAVKSSLPTTRLSLNAKKNYN